MTIQEAIDYTDTVRPNQYSLAMKLGWLSQLDGQIFNELISTRQCPALQGFSPYCAETATSTSLLAEYPYGDALYTAYLQMQLDRENGDADRFNQSAALFNSAYSAFRNDYNRRCPPKPAAGFAM